MDPPSACSTWHCKAGFFRSALQSRLCLCNRHQVPSAMQAGTCTILRAVMTACLTSTREHDMCSKHDTNGCMACCSQCAMSRFWPMLEQGAPCTTEGAIKDHRCEEPAQCVALQIHQSAPEALHGHSRLLTY